MGKRIHFTTSSGRDSTDEYYCLSACGLNEDSDSDWSGSKDRLQVTCKRCLSALAKPPKAIERSYKRERPILFSRAMVLAILANRKFMTRRAIKAPQIPVLNPSPEFPEHAWSAEAQRHPRYGFNVYGTTAAECAESLACSGCSPYGSVGHRLWVKETFFAFGRWEKRFNQKKGRDEWHFVDMTLESFQKYQYEEPDNYTPGPRSSTPAWWRRPSIFMPRVACRIVLQLTKLHVERLQAISEAHAAAEGLIQLPASGRWVISQGDQYFGAASHDPREVFSWLWDLINGSGDWEGNPWVWALTFQRVLEPEVEIPATAIQQGLLSDNRSTS